MLFDLLAEAVMEFLAEGAFEGLFSGWSKPEPPPREGQWSASLGSVAVFLAALGATCTGLAGAVIIRGLLDGELLFVLAVGVALALLAHSLAMRTFVATKRRHLLAHAAIWLSRATLLVVAVTIAIAIVLP
jgi:hypothetical protein